MAAVRRGRAALAHAGRVGRGLGAYGVQAAIAECHAVAPSVRETDWEQIVVLYEALGRPKDAHDAWQRARARGVAARDLQRWIDAKKRIYGY